MQPAARSAGSSRSTARRCSGLPPVWSTSRAAASAVSGHAELRRRARASSSGVSGRGRRIAPSASFSQPSDSASGAAAAHDEDEQRRAVAQPARAEQQRAQGVGVGEVRVVDDDHAVRARPSRSSSSIPTVRCWSAPKTSTCAAPAEPQQLVDDREAQARLGVVAAGAQHAHAGQLRRGSARRAWSCRCPPRPRSDEHARAAGGDLREQRVQRRDLVLSPDEGLRHLHVARNSRSAPRTGRASAIIVVTASSSTT